MIMYTTFQLILPNLKNYITKIHVCGDIFFCTSSIINVTLYMCGVSRNTIDLGATIYKMTFLSRTLQHVSYYTLYKAAFFSM